MEHICESINENVNCVNDILKFFGEECENDIDIFNNKLIKYIFEFKKEPGFIYCIYNEVYEFYGNNVFKLGKAKNLDKRLGSYGTYYVEPCQIKASSNILSHCDFAEYLLFIAIPN